MKSKNSKVVLRWLAYLGTNLFMMSTGMAEIYSSATVWCKCCIKVSLSD
jgi:hypothetical protein